MKKPSRDEYGRAFIRQAKENFSPMDYVSLGRDMEARGMRWSNEKQRFVKARVK